MPIYYSEYILVWDKITESRTVIRETKNEIAVQEDMVAYAVAIL